MFIGRMGVGRDQFSMHRRGGIWYVQFYNPATRKYLPGRSTREYLRNAALVTVANWLREGIPSPQRGVRSLRNIHELLDVDTALSIIRNAQLTPRDVELIVGALQDRNLIRDATIGAGPGSEPLVPFLERFWNYRDSPYVRERIAHGQRISRHHCHDAYNRLRAYWQPYFGSEKTLSSLRRSDINEFSLWLKEKRSLKPNTINRVLSVDTVALHCAARNELIHSNPAEGLMTFSAKAAKRGVLTDDEVKKLFQEHNPPDELLRVFHLVNRTLLEMLVELPLAAVPTHV